MAPCLDGYLAVKNGELYQISYYPKVEVSEEYRHRLNAFNCEDGVTVFDIINGKEGVFFVEEYCNQGQLMNTPHTLYFLVNLIKVFQKHIDVHGQVWPLMVLHHQGRMKLRAPRLLTQAQMASICATASVRDHVAPEFKLQDEVGLALKRTDAWSMGYIYFVARTSSKPSFDSNGNCRLPESLTD
jgi:hypothetical protein